jgi:hypothetical protein
MDTPSWKSEDHGTLVLNGSAIGQGEGFVWIQARRAYCDRGHWDWGIQGLPFQPDIAPTPSYYFMRMDNGVAEIEAWLSRQMGATYQGRTLADMDDSAAFARNQPMSGTWEKQGNTLMTRLPSSEGNVQATLTEKQTLSGPVFVFDIQGISSIDDSDRFPRAYMDLDRALDEIESFFSWRLLQVPSEIPARLEDINKPMGETLLQSTLAAKPTTSKRKMKP